MLYEQTTPMKTKINYDAIRAEKNEMLKRFLLAKKKAEQSGQIVTKPI